MKRLRVIITVPFLAILACKGLTPAVQTPTENVLESVRQTIDAVHVSKTIPSTQLPNNTETPTAAPTNTEVPTVVPTDTVTPTKLKPPTTTATATLVPTPTLLKILLTPVELSIAECGSKNIQPGQRILMEGYLAIGAGRYFLNDSSYPVHLITDPDSWSEEVLWIPAGNKSNSMYFDEGKPIIKDNKGQIIPWRGNKYVTRRLITVIGTFQYKYDNLNCHINIEKIY